MLHQQQLCLQTLDKILLVRRFLLNEGVELLYKVAEQQGGGKADKEDNATLLQEVRISLQFKSV
jgi:hypothetical protein